MRSSAVLLGILLTSVSTTVTHAEIVRSSESWFVSPPFQKNEEARKAISGAACVQGTSHCFAVNDEKKYAQFFDIEGRTVRPKQVIRLLPDQLDGVEMKEMDAEGVAYAPPAGGLPAYYYVVGSHGRGRKGALRPSVFYLTRFPVDQGTGLPAFTFNDDDAATQVQRTALLRETIKKELPDYAEQPLDKCGVTVEGIALKDSDIVLGLRGPSLDGEAYTLRVAIKDLFKETAPPATVDRLALGKGVGIRDMASVRGGILILAGRSHDGKPATDAPANCRDPDPLPSPAIWFWTGNTGDPAKPLGTLPGIGPDMKAEAIVVLEESPSSYRVLVMFDGIENGGPIEFAVGH